MDSYTSTEAKREFGDVIMKAQSGPVCINRNGKVVAVVVSASEYEMLSNLKELQLTHEVREGLADYNSGNLASGKDVFERLRKKVED